MHPCMGVHTMHVCVQHLSLECKSKGSILLRRTTQCIGCWTEMGC